MQYWLVKTEPETYAWSDLAKDGRTSWTGVRNFQARNNLRAMNVDDLVFVYHSVKEKAIVGIAKVSKAAYPDATATDGDWVAVDLSVDRAAKKPITLNEIKKIPALKNIVLVKNSRLSVQPVSETEWKTIESMLG